MKYDVNQPLVSFKGEPLKMSDAKDAPPATLGMVLEFVLVNANPEEFRTAGDKHGLYKLLRKVHDAKPVLSLEAAEVELMKKAAAILPVVALGAVYDELEAPAAHKATVTEVRRDGNVAEIVSDAQRGAERSTP